MEDQSVKKYQLNILLILENKKDGSTATWGMCGDEKCESKTLHY